MLACQTRDVFLDAPELDGEVGMLCGGGEGRTNALVTVATVQSLAARYLNLDGPLPMVEGAPKPRGGGTAKHQKGGEECGRSTSKRREQG